MTKKEFAVFAAALKTYFPREKELLPNTQAMELWYRQLQDIPYEIIELVLNKWVAINDWSPSIAKIREMAATIKCGEKPLWSDGWEQVQIAIRKYGRTEAGKALASMDEITRQTVKRLGWVDLCLSTNAMADRANFRMMFEQIAERQHRERQLPVTLTNLIEAVREKENQMLLERKEQQ